ncbi:hypothetical protein CR513_56953, partial [Mucuna pruriens]
MDPLPTLKIVFSVVVQQERQRGPTRGKSYGGKNSSKVCTDCDKTRHTVETCYCKHGFSSNYFMKNNSSTVNYSAKDDMEHMEEEFNTTVDSYKSTPFTHEQYEKLISLIQHSLTLSPNLNLVINQMRISISNKSNHGTWILDSGASGHICSSINWFQSYFNIQPVNVKLPNGNHVLAKLARTVKAESGGGTIIEVAPLTTLPTRFPSTLASLPVLKTLSNRQLKMRNPTRHHKVKEECPGCSIKGRVKQEKTCVFNGSNNKGRFVQLVDPFFNTTRESPFQLKKYPKWLLFEFSNPEPVAEKPRPKSRVEEECQAEILTLLTTETTAAANLVVGWRTLMWLR